ncbi:MAG TPA: DUF4040 domain-containing protein [Coprothermobacter proteolyticus]|jgi:uncharacterized MnhB-related membrane protein|uniref:Membrane bound hydrogenase, MbhD subunit n=1 Tax=Coprothermobacter proteolyticus (strain ATCC 35245 / DSM 5265 / OCM 4 / BT) TaxID=309798 RepID=B5Y911_COPPD|nr:hydrogenase subunit MbhD domain-containing protein [Coprothermobacter proteolyticus]MBK6585952.1 DUF4040 domain-containing protein [Coprothermobacter sp.]ACI17628.1 hydrogenase [Coprothermobacter proteolyticus DSM 5265]MBP8983798.1 DUF4040 domain-containing protein [Coprothermobacter sp.]NLT84301.1 DUF4040 domain-containing protein [Coprothermobacter proteolyticus]HOA64721.1 DUF4040 domain-containing protein [Coprothermobacter proteolyticus]
MSNGILLLHVINLVGALISAWFTVLQRNLVRAVIGQAVMGSFVALEFLLLNAPDVAIAEAAVGVVVVPIIFFVVLQRTKEVEE